MADENSSGVGKVRNGVEKSKRRYRSSRYLPEELQEEVQVRLPVKSLIRFKSVCQKWRLRFESRLFIALYDQRHPRLDYNSSLELHTISLENLRKMVPGLNLQHGCTTLETETNTGDRWRRGYYVFGPLQNGIYCLTSHNVETSSFSYCILSGKISLCNPATGDYKFADPFPHEFHPMLSEISSSKRPCHLHFGFGSVKTSTKYKIRRCVQVNNSCSKEALDYRVVVLIKYGKEEPYSFLVFVYHVNRHEWEKIVDYEPGKKNVGDRKATHAFDLQQGRIIRRISKPLEVCTQSFFKGCCHWTITHQDGTYSVLLFNVADQSFKLVGGPPHHMDYVTDERVYNGGDALVFHGHLAFIRNFNVLPSSSLKAMQNIEIGVWMMMEYGVEESWTRIYTIKPSFTGHFTRLYGIDYEEQSGGIQIKRLFLKVRHDDDTHETVSCDDAGHEVVSFHEAEPKVGWNTPGISTYIETLERL